MRCDESPLDCYQSIALYLWRHLQLEIQTTDDWSPLVPGKLVEDIAQSEMVWNAAEKCFCNLKSIGFVQRSKQSVRVCLKP